MAAKIRKQAELPGRNGTACAIAVYVNVIGQNFARIVSDWFVETAQAIRHLHVSFMGRFAAPRTYKLQSL
jgi:hypothetical protein